MELQVYISKLKDEKFDYNVENQNGDREYAPKPISGGYRLDNLYKDIVHRVIDHEENTKKTDWGTFVIKFEKTALVEYLLKYQISMEKSFDLGKINSLLRTATELPDGEYLLVAQEIF